MTFTMVSFEFAGAILVDFEFFAYSWVGSFVDASVFILWVTHKYLKKKKKNKRKRKKQVKTRSFCLQQKVRAFRQPIFLFF